MKNLSLKRWAATILAGLAAGICAYTVPLVLRIFPSVLGFIGTAWGMSALGISCAAACGVIFSQATAYGLAYCAGHAAMLVLPALVITKIFSKRGAYRSAAAYSAVICGLSQYVSTCLEPLILIGDPFAGYSEFASLFTDTLLQQASAMNLEAAKLEQLQYICAFFRHSAPDIAVVSIVVSSMLAGLINVVIARILCKKFKVRTKAMAPFHKWVLSPSFYRGSLILVAGALLVSFSNIANVSAITLALAIIVVLPYSLMGLCFMLFSFKLKRKGRGFIVFSLVLMLVLFPYSIYGLCMMGMADKMFGIRHAAGRRK